LTPFDQENLEVRWISYRHPEEPLHYTEKYRKYGNHKGFVDREQSNMEGTNELDSFHLKDHEDG
jgi:hypothetical protein